VIEGEERGSSRSRARLGLWWLGPRQGGEENRAPARLGRQLDEEESDGPTERRRELACGGKGSEAIGPTGQKPRMK
jgi:hypothetical protein